MFFIPLIFCHCWFLGKDARESSYIQELFSVFCFTSKKFQNNNLRENLKIQLFLNKKILYHFKCSFAFLFLFIFIVKIKLRDQKMNLLIFLVINV